MFRHIKIHAEINERVRFYVAGGRRKKYTGRVRGVQVFLQEHGKDQISREVFYYVETSGDKRHTTVCEDSLVAVWSEPNRRWENIRHDGR